MLTLDQFLPTPAAFNVLDYLLPNDLMHALGESTLNGIYQTTHQIARVRMPQKILEIGVWAGYSAAAFLKAVPRALFVGLDADNGLHGGELGLLEQTRWNLPRWFPEAWIDLQQADTQAPETMARLQAHWQGTFDLIHVDGDHSEQGCRQDLHTTLPLLSENGVLLVDDYTNIQDVQRAVDDFLEEWGAEYRGLFIPSPHGQMLIQKV